MDFQIQNEIKEIQDALLNKQLKKAEELALNILKKAEQPYHPSFFQVLLNLGESLFYQGFHGAAKAVFNRVILLDPQGTWIPAVENIIRNIDIPSERKDINTLLEVPKKTVAAAILVKNEERCIKRCIDSIIDAVDEIVVIDTGSTDNTLKILKSYRNIKILHFDWCNDFSAARNFGLANIQSDWVLRVDADEYLHQDDIHNVRIAAGLFDNVDPVPVISGVNLDLIGEQLLVSYDQSRMFPLKRGLSYSGRVHEQVSSKEQRGNYTDIKVRIRFFHDGYDKQIMSDKKKLERNIELLKQMIEEEPDVPTWSFYLGREMFSMGQVDEAIELLLEAEKKALTSPWFGRSADIYTNLVKAYMRKREFGLAKDACIRALSKDPEFPDHHYLLGFIDTQQAVNLYLEAEQSLNKAKQYFHTYRGVVSPDNSIFNYKADIALADVARLTGDLVVAAKTFKDVLNRHPNNMGVKKQLENIEIQSLELSNLLNKPTISD